MSDHVYTQGDNRLTAVRLVHTYQYQGLNPYAAGGIVFQYKKMQKT